VRHQRSASSFLANIVVFHHPTSSRCLSMAPSRTRKTTRKVAEDVECEHCGKIVNRMGLGRHQTSQACLEAREQKIEDARRQTQEAYDSIFNYHLNKSGCALCNDLSNSLSNLIAENAAASGALPILAAGPSRHRAFEGTMEEGEIAIYYYGCQSYWVLRCS